MFLGGADEFVALLVFARKWCKGGGIKGLGGFGIDGKFTDNLIFADFD